MKNWKKQENLKPFHDAIKKQEIINLFRKAYDQGYNYGMTDVNFEHKDKAIMNEEFDNLFQALLEKLEIRN